MQGKTRESLYNDILIGVANGYSIEYQKQLVKQVLDVLKNQ